MNVAYFPLFLREWIGERKQDQHNCRDPSYAIEEPRVSVTSHELFFVDQQEHENQHRGKRDDVDNLRKDRKLHQWDPRKQDHTGSRSKQNGVKPIKDRGFLETAI